MIHSKTIFGVSYILLLIFSGQSQAAGYCGTYNGRAVYQEIEGHTCEELFNNLRNSEASTSPRNSNYNTDATRQAGMQQIQQGIQQLQKIYSTPTEPSPPAEEESRSGAQNSFSAAEAAFEEDDWGKRATSKQTNECNCKIVTGSCTGNISLTKSSKTGRDFIVESSEPYCSKVSYYIDNTPYTTLLTSSNTSLEHSSSLKPLTEKNFKIYKCEICSK